MNTDKGRFRIINAGDDDRLFLRMLTPNMPEYASNDYTRPVFPEGDISFLHGISAIGTKFNPAEDLGPQGKKNHTAGWKKASMAQKGVLIFDFR